MSMLSQNGVEGHYERACLEVDALSVVLQNMYMHDYSA